MRIAACRTYHARRIGMKLLSMPDGKSALKIYYLSIIGRDKPEIFEWERCALSREEFENKLLQSGFEGIGFVTAFPHVTKLFRFSPFAETVVDVLECRTGDLSRLDCTRADDWHEFACYAEALIAAEEYAAWAQSSRVEDYLRFIAPSTNFPIANHVKLAAYFAQEHDETHE